MQDSLPSLIGVVACGGQSSRMGRDKSLSVYHGKSQRYFLYDQLKPLCENVFLSCTEKQSGEIEKGYSFLTDKKEFSNCGPISGLLSAFQEHSNKSILYVGCDYPFLTIELLQELVSMRNLKSSAVVYLNTQTNITEPLIAIYENSIYSELLFRFRNNEHSLRKFLDDSKNINLIPKAGNHFISIDTPEEYKLALRELNKTP
jgi:molybdopterin-guanine dinucleotide biosynthesis protein A